MKKDASIREADVPDVRCDTCGRWVFLDETPFDTREGAASGGAFVCSICTRLLPMESRMQRQDCLVEELQGKVTALEALVQKLTAKLRETEQTCVDVADDAESLPGGEMLPETLGQEQPPPVSPLEPREGCEGIELTGTANAPVTQPGTTERQGQAHVGMGAAKPGGGQQEGRHQRGEEEAPDGTQVPLAVQHGHKQKPGLIWPPGNNSSVSAPADSGGPSPLTQPGHATEKRGKRSQRKGPHVERNTDERPPLGTPKEVVVVGDENVGLVAATVVANVGSINAVEFIYGERTTLEEAIGYAAEYEKGAREVPRRFILHAGTHDILGGRPQEVVEVLEARWNGRPGSLVVCSVPEIAHRGGEVRAASILVNAKLKKWCKRTGSCFLDLSNMGKSQRLRKDGSTYATEYALEVGQAIGDIAARFLGVPPAPREGGTWPRQKKHRYLRTPQKMRTPRSHYQGGVEQPPNHDARQGRWQTRASCARQQQRVEQLPNSDLTQGRWKTRASCAHHQQRVEPPPSSDTRQGHWELARLQDEQDSYWRQTDLANLIETSVQRALARARPGY